MIQPMIWGWLALSNMAMECVNVQDDILAGAARSVVFYHPTSCSHADKQESISLLRLHFSNINDDRNDYWHGWIAGQSMAIEPMLSSNYQQNYFGLSLWMPEQFAVQEFDMDLDEWLKSHGVALSLAFGDKRSGLPRLRLDYRWHDIAPKDWFLQLEIPF